VRSCGGSVAGWIGLGRGAVCRARVACRMTTTRSVSKVGKEGRWSGCVCCCCVKKIRVETGRRRRRRAAAFKRSISGEHGPSLDERLLNTASTRLHMSSEAVFAVTPKYTLRCRYTYHVTSSPQSTSTLFAHKTSKLEHAKKTGKRME
jgi:hypothetical protein